MNRETALGYASEYFDGGRFLADLARKVAYRTVSEDDDSAEVLRAYLAEEVAPELRGMGFVASILDNPLPRCGPYLVAERIEDACLPTVLMYAHGDVVRGQDAAWREGLAPWDVRVEGDRIYGRGTADNKGQFAVNMGALRATLAARGGRLGFNLRLLVESAEERGSPGLGDFCEKHREALQADLFLASDGPRLSASQPTLFLGSRGIQNFELSLELREGAHHSGNWGGLLRNAGTALASAIASLVDARGAIATPLLKPSSVPESVRSSVASLPVGQSPGDPIVDEDWGEPGLTAAERVFAWNTLEVLALECGSVSKPMGAIPAVARAVLQLRYVVGTDLHDLESRLQEHFVARGMPWVRVAALMHMAATRLDPRHPAVMMVAGSVRATTGIEPVVLPNIGGTIPNDAFSEVLGLPTIWVPHSYPGCSQHAPDEHLLASTAREGLRIMAGVFWDLGDAGRAALGIPAARRAPA